MPEPFDAEFAARETARIIEDWSNRGRHWDARADEMADMSGAFNAPLLDTARIDHGQMVLDLATGAGEPALTIAQMIAPDGHLTATDLVEDMLAGAKRRVAAQKITNIDFQIADMTDLPFENNHFDRVVCRFGIMFVPYPEQAARETWRVLKPGGRAAFMVWGPREHTTGFEVVAKAADEIFGEDDPLIDFETPFKLSGETALRDALNAGGLKDVEVHDLKFFPKIPVGIRFWDAQLDMGLGRRYELASDDQKEHLERAIMRLAEPTISEGAYNLSVHVKIGTGVKRG